MIPGQIIDYLERNQVPFAVRSHPRAVDAQHLAAALHVSGHRVAKTVVVRAAGTQWLALLPASRRLHAPQLARELHVTKVELVPEPEFESIFGPCEVGAEPPFGGLYGLPVLVDASLARCDYLIFRGGSHVESIEMRFLDFARLEHPTFSRFSAPLPEAPLPYVWEEEVRL
jgi:Ala-tRNA(Pro) deacylase